MGEEYEVETADDGVMRSSKFEPAIIRTICCYRPDRTSHGRGNVAGTIAIRWLHWLRIVLTAHGQDDVIVVVNLVHDYLVKPVGMEELQLAVQTAFIYAKTDDDFDVDYDRTDG